MAWAKVSLVIGVLLVALGFAAGVEPSSTTVGGQSYACDGAISTSWLVSGTSAAPREPAAAPRERAIRLQVEKQCNSLLRTSQWLTWASLALGVLALLVGWTTLRPDLAEAPARVG